MQGLKIYMYSDDIFTVHTQEHVQLVAFAWSTFTEAAGAAGAALFDRIGLHRYEGAVLVSRDTTVSQQPDQPP